MRQSQDSETKSFIAEIHDQASITTTIESPKRNARVGDWLECDPLEAARWWIFDATQCDRVTSWALGLSDETKAHGATTGLYSTLGPNNLGPNWQLADQQCRDSLLNLNCLTSLDRVSTQSQLCGFLLGPLFLQRLCACIHLDCVSDCVGDSVPFQQVYFAAANGSLFLSR